VQLCEQRQTSDTPELKILVFISIYMIFLYLILLRLFFSVIPESLDFTDNDFWTSGVPCERLKNVLFNQKMLIHNKITGYFLCKCIAMKYYVTGGGD
jgi:hypothetical protein